MTKAIIIEDEKKGLNNLKNILAEHCTDISVLGEAGSIAEGKQLLKKLKSKLDVAFLDINLPDGLVFQLLNDLDKVSFEVIFVTAFQEHAIKACNYSSIGFVLKPIDPDDLKEAVSRINVGKSNYMNERLEVFNQHYNNNKPNPFKKMSISALDGIYFINIQDIIRCEAEDNYTHIHLSNGDKITASRTIKAYEDMLGSVNFYRVHKSHLINLNYMKKFVKGDGGYLVMDDGIKIEVSRRRRPAFMEQMRRLQEGI